MSAVEVVPKESVVDARGGLNKGSGTILPRRIVKYVSSAVDGIDVSSAATDPLAGVNGESAALPGEYASIRLRGRVIVTAGGSFSRGSKLTSDGSGRAIATTTSGHNVLGYAASDSTGADTLAVVELTPGASVP